MIEPRRRVDGLAGSYRQLQAVRGASFGVEARVAEPLRRVDDEASGRRQAVREAALDAEACA